MLSYWPQHRLWPQIVSYVNELSLELDSRPTFEPTYPGRVLERGLVSLYRFGHL